MNVSSRCWPAIVLLALLGGPLSAAEVRIIAWNVEDTGADPRANENRLRQLARQGFDLWGLCEVQEANFNRYLNAVNDGAADAGLEAEYQPIEGLTGGSRRLLILFPIATLIPPSKSNHFAVNHFAIPPLLRRKLK